MDLLLLLLWCSTEEGFGGSCVGLAGGWRAKIKISRQNKAKRKMGVIYMFSLSERT
jgi:hypothetical protein